MYFNFPLFSRLAERAYQEVGGSSYPLEDVLEVFRYYFDSYESTFGKVHPNINMKQIRHIIEIMPFIEATYSDIDPDHYEALIDKHFRTRYHNCDHNINHFFERDENCLRFPWFKQDASAAEIDAYSRLIARLCETAKTKQRVTATERQLQDGDNEKFKARCFLLSLDFVGEQTKQARKILLAPFSGSGSHRSGNHKRAAAPQDAEAITGGGAATVPARCSECRHHCYYTDGQMLAADGGTVDTSKKTPDKYTHYCLAAPSGFRKLNKNGRLSWKSCRGTILTVQCSTSQIRTT